MAISSLAGLGKMTELRQRILFVLGSLVVFRIGTHIPVPGVDRADSRFDRRCIQHVQWRGVGAIVNICTGCNALYIRLDHYSDDEFHYSAT